jgi:glycosyltransferase involved in cell wall biosynthesis
MLTTFYPPFSFGGDAVGIQRMARALVRRGHAVTVIHDADAYLTLGGVPGPAHPAPDDPGIVTLASGSRRAGFVSNLLTQQTGRPVMHGARIRAVLEAGRFDIVWHNNVSLAGGPGLFGLGGGLQVYEAHEHWLVCPMHVLWRYNRELCDGRRCLSCTLSFRRPPQPWRWTGMLERRGRAIDLFVAKSEFSRAKHAEFGFPFPMAVLPYFLPPLPAVPAPDPAPPHPRPYFLFVGRLEKIKGLQDVFPAFAGPGETDLLVLGAGEYEAELKRLAGANPRIRFLGRKPPHELDAFYRGALGLVVPSICYETFGIILIEAFRLGTPVIARELGPFPEIVGASGGGLMFRDEAGLRAAMASLAGEPGLRARLSAAAEAAFARLWSEAPVLEAWGEALARAAAAAGRGDLSRRLAAGVLSEGAG